VRGVEAGEERGGEEIIVFLTPMYNYACTLNQMPVL
jgi:hypothetical protein